MPDTPVFPGADETTPSLSQYFSWINNTNEGATAAQTAANLRFFQWLHDEYGMVLDIYAFDAGAIDGAGGYGSADSERFHRQFPQGFAPLVAQAKAMGTRLGLWCGPDGFGDTPAEEAARHELMVSLCRDHGFALFKMDGVCGALRPEKQDAFVRMLTECRRHRPDLILLNHRLKLGKGMPHATTYLWEGVETYVDVHVANKRCATHNRAWALERGNVPDLGRLTEDHGVCLSSCLDGWEDDLVVQAFGRSLILAPELYGNPWLLSDAEYPRLARIFNLHRRLRGLLVRGMLLPEAAFGPHAVSRGDGAHRVLCLRNPGWEPRTVRVPLDATIGLDAAGPFTVRRLHPRERWLGTFTTGAEVTVEIEPFRACLLEIAGSAAGIAVSGVDAEVVREMPGKPVELRLLGIPGSRSEVRLDLGGNRFSRATLDGADVTALLSGAAVPVDFAGTTPSQPWHRKLGDLVPAPAPADAEALYEATVFAADNNALEARELERSGPTTIPAVQAARDAFFDQPLFRQRHLWDRNLFDDDASTGLGVGRRWGEQRIRGGSFRLDLGEARYLDRLTLDVRDEYELQPLKSQESVWGSVSADLHEWVPVRFFAGSALEAVISDHRPWRYIRLDRCPDLIREVRATFRGVSLQRVGWRASNLFAPWTGKRWSPWGPMQVEQAWEWSFTLTETVPGSMLCIAIHGDHGHELVWCALRVEDGAGGTVWRGCPRRSPSFPANTWECPVRPCLGNSTWYVPVTVDLIGKRCTAVAMLLNNGKPDLRCEVWITAAKPPLIARTLVLTPV